MIFDDSDSSPRATLTPVAADHWGTGSTPGSTASGSIPFTVEMTLRWVVVTWTTRSLTLQSGHGVTTDQLCGATPSRRTVNPSATVE
jgi:hypothetical protein